mgnify:CR=1 FL=1
MDKNSLLYQLMAMRMNGIMNGVAEQDEDYQASLSAADLQYYKHPFRFDYSCIFTSGKNQFDDLWSEWYSFQLLALTKDTPLAELDYQDMFRCLPEEQQKEILGKREYFPGLAGISL